MSRKHKNFDEPAVEHDGEFKGISPEGNVLVENPNNDQVVALPPGSDEDDLNTAKEPPAGNVGVEFHDDEKPKRKEPVNAVLEGLKKEGFAIIHQDGDAVTVDRGKGQVSVNLNAGLEGCLQQYRSVVG